MHKKNTETASENAHCTCKNIYGLFLPNKQLSWVLSFLLLCSLCIFVAGYFLGKKQAMEERNDQLQEELFADHIYTQVLINNDNNTKIDAQINADLITKSKEDYPIGNVHTDNNSYYAPLIGFGYERSAKNFKQKLAAKNIPVDIHAIQSKNVRGISKTWYQVTTYNYENKEELQLLVDRISKEEKLNGVKILTR